MNVHAHNTSRIVNRNMGRPLFVIGYDLLGADLKQVSRELLKAFRVIANAWAGVAGEPISCRNA